MKLFIWYNIGGGPSYGADCVVALALDLNEARRVASNPIDASFGREHGEDRLPVGQWMNGEILTREPDRVLDTADAIYFMHSE